MRAEDGDNTVTADSGFTDTEAGLDACAFHSHVSTQTVRESLDLFDGVVLIGEEGHVGSELAGDGQPFRQQVRSDHLAGVVGLGHLYREQTGRTDADHQDRLATLERLPCAVDGDGQQLRSGCFGVRDVVGNLHDVPRPRNRQLRVTGADDTRVHAVTRLEVLHLGAHFKDLPRDFVAPRGIGARTPATDA